MPLVDPFQRHIIYLRISVTDRCNFRCLYCMPEEGAPVAPRDDLLTRDEILRLARIAASLGISRIRLTGGEPLIRKDIVEIVAGIRAIPGIQELSLTTNGFLLEQYALPLRQAGLHRVNVSLDTLRPERFRRIARRGNLEAVLRGIAAARQQELAPIKINCVTLRGWNDDEVVDFARLSLDHPFGVRFIELMPINWTPSPTESPRRISIPLMPVENAVSRRPDISPVITPVTGGQLDAISLQRAFLSVAEVRARIEAALGPLLPATEVHNGPARSYRLPGARGTIGFISQITAHNCSRCNRLRLTADGHLRPCLMADGEIDLRTLLRSGASDRQIAECFRTAVQHKPAEHRVNEGSLPAGRNMSQIGG
ncbi:MAG: GTP 3',8-cyclase MoaA [Chloroherpetonaceae bacterium]|nr:GTP 3',8-cyclase MoaA [Chthonomonadaceae bacterium]MDW8207516.1 GTP 3',8-cyclase MoaA [Chloroherpetonaceae bacterium]